MPMTFYAVVAAILIGFVGGWKVENWRWGASLQDVANAKYSAVVKVRGQDQTLQASANKAGIRSQSRLDKQEEKADAIKSEIEIALSKLPACIVPGNVVGLLDDASRGSPDTEDPGSSSKPGSPKPSADPAPPSTAAAELATCAINYTDVCIPNAIERDELRRLYNEIKDRINTWSP